MTCRIANVLKSHGVTKGDRVGVYLPMCPTAAAVMLACARIGEYQYPSTLNLNDNRIFHCEV